MDSHTTTNRESKMNEKHLRYAEREMDAMKVGYTKVIGGLVVTRWTVALYEVGTWGRGTVDAETAARMIAESI